MSARKWVKSIKFSIIVKILQANVNFPDKKTFLPFVCVCIWEWIWFFIGVILEENATRCMQKIVSHSKRREMKVKVLDAKWSEMDLIEMFSRNRSFRTWIYPPESVLHSSNSENSCSNSLFEGTVNFSLRLVKKWKSDYCWLQPNQRKE